MLHNDKILPHLKETFQGSFHSSQDYQQTDLTKEAYELWNYVRYTGPVWIRMNIKRRVMRVRLGS
jgi:hypothetical protein